MVSIRHNPQAPESGRLPRSAYNEDHDVPIATQAEAEAGTATDKLMTPQRTAQAIAALGAGGGSVAWADVTGKPTTFAPSAHTHIIGDVTGLQAALDGKQAVTTVLTNTTASFTTAQEAKLAGLAPGATANAADSALRDRSTHTGTQAISTVTGLQAALDGKQATLVSGTSLKTVNGNSLLGSGDITISGGGSASWGGITGTLSAQTDLQTALNARQPLATVLTNTTAAFTTAQETKLAGIASGATENATDAQLRDRSTHTGVQAISTVTGLQAALDAKVASNPTGITGADAITNIVSLTQAEYDAIPTKNATTFYVVTA